MDHAVSGLHTTGNRLVELAAPDGVGLLGDLSAIIEQLGTASPDAAAPRLQVPDTFKALTRFLETYKRNVLIKQEWPAIYRAYQHASHSECHELIAMDQAIAHQNRTTPFAEASRRIGQFQLKRLAPLRGERVITRYMTAVEEGRAQGWHTLVLGLTLSVYSLPVRQGLMHYAQQILISYLESATHSFPVTDDEVRTAIEELVADLPSELEKLLNPVI